MKNENVKPIIRNTKHGKIAIFVYADCHRVYLIDGDDASFLYQRANTNLTSFRE